MNREVENVLAVLDGFRMCGQMDYSAYSRLHDLISELDVAEPMPEQPKEGNNPLYDFSGWTTEMIVAKIREIERKKEIAYKEYIDLVASFNSQLRALYNPLSNENHFNCDEAPKEEEHESLERNRP